MPSVEDSIVKHAEAGGPEEPAANEDEHAPHDVTVEDPTAADNDVHPETAEAAELFAHPDPEGEATGGEEAIKHEDDHHDVNNDDLHHLPLPEPEPVVKPDPHHDEAAAHPMEGVEEAHHVEEHHEPTGTVKDPLAHVDHGTDPDQAALDAGEEAAAAAMEAAAAAEAAIGNVLDDVGVDVHMPGASVTLDHHVDHHHHHHHQTEDDEVALAAAAAAAAVQAADGMAVVVDQALLATAAAAAASQVAEVLAEQPTDIGLHDYAPLPDGSGTAAAVALAAHAGAPGRDGNHGDLLHARREKDRKRYSAMSPEARAAYNAHRRELYHKQGEQARKRRRERERERYHSLEGESKKQRNERRAKLERDRYNRLNKDELAARNAKRRERAKARKMQNKNVAAAGGPAVEETIAVTVVPVIPPPEVIKTEGMEDHNGEVGVGVPTLPEPDMVGAPLPEATVDVTDAAMADASALAAEVAEQVIAGTNLDSAMEAAAASGRLQAEEEDGPTVQI